MGKPIPYDYRKKIISEHEKGKSFSKIAAALGYSISGVKKIWYTYQREGASSLKPDYSNCGKKSPFTEQTRTKVSDLKTGSQGAGFVYSMFRKKYPNQRAPSIRTIQRWWEDKPTKRLRGRPPEKEKKHGLKNL